MRTQSDAVTAFRNLHKSGCFILPNPWDLGTAKLLYHLGYAALATTSAGLAFSRGLPDAVTAVDLETTLTHIRELVDATPLPVNADFQAGFAVAPEAVAQNVLRCVKTGVAGLSIEDATGVSEAPLFERALAIERIRAARSAIDASGKPVVLTARCEAWLLGLEDADRVVFDRLVAFAEAGADCLYAPGVRDEKKIADLVSAVAPKPVNVLMGAPGAPDVAALAELGVRRVSVGSAFARAAFGALINVARGVLETGRFDVLEGAASFEQLNKVFGG